MASSPRSVSVQNWLHSSSKKHPYRKSDRFTPFAPGLINVTTLSIALFLRVLPSSQSISWSAWPIRFKLNPLYFFTFLHYVVSISILIGAVTSRSVFLTDTRHQTCTVTPWLYTNSVCPQSQRRRKRTCRTIVSYPLKPTVSSIFPQSTQY